MTEHSGWNSGRTSRTGGNDLVIGGGEPWIIAIGGTARGLAEFGSVG